MSDSKCCNDTFVVAVVGVIVFTTFVAVTSCVGDSITFFLLVGRPSVTTFTTDFVLLVDALVPLLDTAAVLSALAAVPATSVVPFLATAFGVLLRPFLRRNVNE